MYGNAIAAIAGFCLASAIYGFSLSTFVGAIVSITIIMGGACVVNNITDREVDSHMERTKKRALVSGQISLRAAVIYGALLLLVGFIGLWLFSNPLTVLVGAIGVIDYVIFYAWAKRHTNYGTIIGTIAGAAPLMAGYTALSGAIDSAAIILFVIMFFWQMVHFYAIAIFRERDYVAAGIRVHPAIYGVRKTKNRMLIYMIGFTISLPLLTLFDYTGVLYALAALAIAWYWLYDALKHYKAHDAPKWARQVFGHSLVVLLAFCTAIALGGFLP